ncbi:hypothetical protein [Xanthomonas theicola]|uniref:hypothetical protein n=1 Tax=Xanthomonas theicola TaxID=56464 RepID=UPI000FF88BA4|nr:hypothetical protein [Xanthomonas theicola]QNH26801.1 hypothetical protein G4Q83_21685 [Xanthomonas theicola]
MQSKALRSLVAVAASFLLFVPGLVMAFALGGTLNLEVAIAATLIFIMVARWLPRLRWAIAVVAALVIAVPPYPYWTNWDESRGQYLHFFHGFNLQNLPIAAFVVVFVLALLLFVAIFWAVRRRETSRDSPG